MVQHKPKTSSFTSLDERLEISQVTVGHKFPLVPWYRLKHIKPVAGTNMKRDEELDLLSSHHNFFYDPHLDDVLANHLGDNQLANLVACARHVHTFRQHVPTLEHVSLDSRITLRWRPQFARKLELRGRKQARIAPEAKMVYIITCQKYLT